MPDGASAELSAGKSNQTATRLTAADQFVSKKGSGGLRREREKTRSRNLYLHWRKEGRGGGERVAEVEGGGGGGGREVLRCQ